MLGKRYMEKLTRPVTAPVESAVFISSLAFIMAFIAICVVITRES